MHYFKGFYSWSSFSLTVIVSDLAIHSILKRNPKYKVAFLHLLQLHFVYLKELQWTAYRSDSHRLNQKKLILLTNVVEATVMIQSISASIQKKNDSMKQFRVGQKN